MVTYLFLSAFLAVIGLAIITTVLVIASTRARRQRDLNRRKGELASEQELENYLGRLDQATTAGDIDRLGDHDEGES